MPKEEGGNGCAGSRLAFVPSSLMIGVTTALTTDVPAIPLFWVMLACAVPDQLHLVFAKRQVISQEWLIRRLPFLTSCGASAVVSQTKLPLAVMLLLYLSVLFECSDECATENWRGAGRMWLGLTEFYLWISVGGDAWGRL